MPSVDDSQRPNYPQVRLMAYIEAKEKHKKQKKEKEEKGQA
jgi:hypothetical protein